MIRKLQTRKVKAVSFSSCMFLMMVEILNEEENIKRIEKSFSTSAISIKSDSRSPPQSESPINECNSLLFSNIRKAKLCTVHHKVAE